ncbi:SRPBCC domain-containing protein [Actinacidiphila glaucinigra]|uniref:SRPBCC domain-containing protein n=1 Tax=Actinacidiphila glaucinigra TaxID=235986 RepID=UPI00371127DC
MYSTQVSRRVRATPAAVYRALLDPRAVARWRVPDGMSGHVHAFGAREGGRLRVSLMYDGQQGEGKSGAHTDTYHGYFARLVPDELVIEVIEFETEDAALHGTMTMTTSLTAVDDGTDVVVVHEGVPDVVPREDNEAGTRMALDRLARLVEGAVEE